MSPGEDRRGSLEASLQWELYFVELFIAGLHIDIHILSTTLANGNVVLYSNCQQSTLTSNITSTMRMLRSL